MVEATQPVCQIMCITFMLEKLPLRHDDTMNMTSYIQVHSLMNWGLVGGRASQHKNFNSFISFENIC
jgi:hypothetical protein